MTPALSYPIPLMALTLIQVVVGSLIVFIFIPWIIVPRLSLELADQWVVRMGLMLLGVISAGYVLALLHLFTAVALLVLMIICGWIMRRRQKSRYLLTGGAQVSASFYDWLSGVISWRGQVSEGQKTAVSNLRAFFPKAVLPYVWVLLSLGILGASAWMRFAPNWHHAALFFSDAYETVGWVKGIDTGTLFPNGIYPMGYYIVMAAVQTLTHANAIVFIKFFGAFIGTLLTGSVMWSTYRFSGRVVPALVAGAIYGLLPHLLPYVGNRQLAAEGQEMGNLLVLPIGWMVFQAWVTKRRGYVLGAAAMLAVVGLTHPVAMLNAVLAAIAATIGAWVVSGISGRIFKSFLWMIPIAAIMSLAPLGIAYLTGLRLMTGAATFLAETGPKSTSGIVALPSVSLMVWVALAGIGALFITKLLWYDDVWEMGLPATAFLFLVFAEGVVQLPRFGINSAVLTSRGGEFLALVETLSIGLGVAAVQEAMERIGAKRSWAAGSALAASILGVGFFLKNDPPQPFSGYTMNSDAFVAEFVRIERDFPRLSWVAVANGAYALAVNQGYQYNPSFWVNHVSPDTLWPKYHGLSTKSFAVSQHSIFFFVPSRIDLSRQAPFQPALLSQDRYQQSLLKRWIRSWTRIHGNMPVLFKDSQLTVYWLQNAKNPAL